MNSRRSRALNGPWLVLAILSLGGMTGLAPNRIGRSSEIHWLNHGNGARFRS